MIKRTILLCLAVAQLFMLSGCWNYIEIDEQINVSGIALDIGDQGCRYQLTVEVVTVGGNGNTKFESFLIESGGGTIFEAIRNLMTLTPKKLYFGHCKLMVIGEPLAEYGIGELMDLPLRNHEMRANTEVIIAKGTTGKRVLQTKSIMTNIVSYKISDILKTSEKAVGTAAPPAAYQIYDSIHTQGVSTVIPAFDLYKVGDTDVVKLCGAGVFRSDRLIGYLNEEQLKDLSLMKGKLKTGLVTSEAAGGPYYTTSFEIYKANGQSKINCTQEGITAQYNVKLWVNVGESQMQEDFFDESQLDATRRTLETTLTKNMENLAKAAQQTYHCDFFGVGDHLRQQDPDCWEKYKKDWETEFPKVRFEVVCEVRIISSGVSNVAPK